MYPVSEDYLTAIDEAVVTDKIVGTITLKDETVIEITDADIEAGSLYFTEQCVSGEDLEVGAVVASEMGLTLTNYEDPYALDGARIALQYALLIDVDVWEYVPLGYFYVTEIERKLKAVQLKALDGLILFDVDTTGVIAGGTARELILSCASKAGLILATNEAEMAEMSNSDVYLTLPINDKIKTCRDVLMWVCQLLGAFARMNRQGGLEIVPITAGAPIRSIGRNVRYSTKISDFDLQITGISMEYNETPYMQGSDTLVMELDENPLLSPSEDVSAILTALLEQVSQVQYKPFTSVCAGDPALQAGDYVGLLDAADIGDATVLATKSSWRYRGDHTIIGAGKAVRQPASQENKNVSAVKSAIAEARRIAQATNQSTQLITDTLGGNVLIRTVESSNEILIMDNPDPASARKIWRWNLGGLGYSDNVIGADNPAREYVIAMTIDGAISADFVRTGLLRSINGQFVMDLETGVITSEAGLILTDSTSGLKAQFGSGSMKLINLSNENVIAEFTTAGTRTPTLIVEDVMHLGATRFTPYTSGGRKGTVISVND